MASKAMFRHLIDVNELTHAFSARNLSEIDIQFIEELIAGVPPSAWADPATAPKGRPRDKSFLFEIVANKRNGVDVDKYGVPYLIRVEHLPSLARSLARALYSSCYCSCTPAVPRSLAHAHPLCLSFTRARFHYTALFCSHLSLHFSPLTITL